MRIWTVCCVHVVRHLLAELELGNRPGLLRPSRVRPSAPRQSARNDCPVASCLHQSTVSVVHINNQRIVNQPWPGLGAIQKRVAAPRWFVSDSSG